MKKILEKLLAFGAKKILKKYHPKVVGITGSIGKTSAKEAVYAVLSGKYKVRKNVKNYNNELGVPLTIIGAESGGRSFWRWLRVFAKAFVLLRKTQKYPKILVLEMGADRPGDIGYLTKIAACDIGVVTKVSPAHLEFFGSLEKIAREKSKIVSHLSAEGTAILNNDDSLVGKMKDKTRAKVLTFGLEQGADVTCGEIKLLLEENQPRGMQFKINYRGNSVPTMIPNVIGRHQIYAALIGVAVGLAVGMNLVEISRGLQNYRSPRGRMRLLNGLRGALLIDDTYNSSPHAAVAAVTETAAYADQLGEKNRKIAVLGDMLELGQISAEAHRELGALVAKNNFQMLVAVGEFANDLAAGARANGLNEVKVFEDSEKAGEYLKEIIGQNDIVLLKGSQGVRLEKAVKFLLTEPEEAGRLLVRQTASWKRS